MSGINGRHTQMDTFSGGEDVLCSSKPSGFLRVHLLLFGEGGGILNSTFHCDCVRGIDFGVGTKGKEKNCLRDFFFSGDG